MPTQVNTLPPSLVSELSELRRRLDTIERAPAPVNSFDRYPTAEWDPVDRGIVAGNVWHAASIASVTGLVFDRIETKFTTYGVIKGKREPEIRLAAYRHGRDGSKVIVSASSTWQLSGDTTAYLAAGRIRWVHGIPFGWDYATDTDVYTIELQVRYAIGPEQIPTVRIWTIGAAPTASTSGLQTRSVGTDTDGKNFNTLTYKDGSAYGAGLVDIPARDTGNAKISAMQYCVGLPASRVPDATPDGVLAYDLTWKVSRSPSLSEEVMNL
ncbi:hypothetical protein ABT095_15845 [Kitasatospora sp. NPDC002227]|uniref:hypothetical protein n=1 Tax=Kitasatospora sp. NPDC002227 TaxID=3154773 RepID=UPI003322EB47